MRYLTIEEVSDLGVLLELNRRLLHARGLALEGYIAGEETIHTIIWRRSALEWLRKMFDWCRQSDYFDDWSEETWRDLYVTLDDALAQPNAAVLRVQDHRDDPGGVYYGDLDAEDVEKAKRFETLSKTAGRLDHLGFFTQPLPS